jgi:thiamine pyrophosphokinase
MTTAVVVASGELAPGDTGLLGAASVIVAADGGARWVEAAGLRPDVVVGDLDSIDPAALARLEAAGTPIERHPTDKEASDAELAIERAIGTKPQRVVFIGANGGGRLDHELANVLLLADARYAGIDLRIVRGATVVRAVHGGEGMVIEGAPGDLVSLLPVGGDALGVHTRGLRWPLAGERLSLGRSRGLSNEIVEAEASVHLDAGTLLVVSTARQGERT